MYIYKHNNNNIIYILCLYYHILLEGVDMIWNPQQRFCSPQDKKHWAMNFRFPIPAGAPSRASKVIELTI